MNNRRTAKRIATLVALVLVTVFSAVQYSQAQAEEDGARSNRAAPITVSQLQGTWTATLGGVNGCGTATLLITFTLDATGNGKQTSTQNHTAGCGNSKTSGLPVQIQSFHSNGSGFIAFGCGAGCGYGFYMQVSGNKQIFNMAPQSVPGNYLAGVAIRR
jgi:hypothetical protein